MKGIKMKKNKYNFPRYASNSNNSIYNQFVNDMYYNEVDEKDRYNEKNKNNENWTKNGRIDLYHQAKDDDVFEEDPYTVAQKFIDRTQFPL